MFITLSIAPYSRILQGKSAPQCIRKALSQKNNILGRSGACYDCGMDAEYKRFRNEVIALTLAGSCGMVWAFSKIAAVNQRIGAGEAWLYMFGVLTLIGIGLIVHAAFRAIRDTEA